MYFNEPLEREILISNLCKQKQGEQFTDNEQELQLITNSFDRGNHY